jgi:hypothetical protein
MQKDEISETFNKTADHVAQGLEKTSEEANGRLRSARVTKGGTPSRLREMNRATARAKCSEHDEILTGRSHHP